ncbi:MAG: hypothetical protein AAFX55_12685 [Bacteroidota bacterium]
MKKLIVLVAILCCFESISQTVEDFKGIDSLGRAFTAKLKQGNLEQFKGGTPPKNTWTYDKLLKYQEDLNNSDITIFSGDLIGPSTKASVYSYNLFAYSKSDVHTYNYYFAAIVSIDISDGQPKVEASYLFTEEDALKNWWGHVFGLYHTNTIEKIPEEYRLPICPPPPFKE